MWSYGMFIMYQGWGIRSSNEQCTKLLCQMLLGLLFQLFFKHTIEYTSERNDSNMSLGSDCQFILREVIIMATSGCDSESWSRQSIYFT